MMEGQSRPRAPALSAPGLFFAPPLYHGVDAAHLSLQDALAQGTGALALVEPAGVGHGETSGDRPAPARGQAWGIWPGYSDFRALSYQQSHRVHAASYR